ncbi:MAG: DUF975 family protein [Clostridium sp.]|nr:DUF975 family protein [Clostridium sp.]
MEIDRKDLKRQARLLMAAPRPSFWLVTLTYFLLTTGLSSVASFLFPMEGSLQELNLPALFSTILLLLLGLVMDFGYTLWSMGCARECSPTLGILFDGFSHTTSVLLMNLLIYIYTLGLAFLVTIPLSMVFSFLLMMFWDQQVLFLLCLALLMAFCVAISIAISLRYALAPYLLADYPEEGASAAIRRSVFMMQGYKRELFKLHFSFIGWHILSLCIQLVVLAAALLLGVGSSLPAGASPTDIAAMVNTVAFLPAVSALMALLALPLELWLKPYISVTSALFYDLRSQPDLDDIPLLNID